MDPWVSQNIFFTLFSWFWQSKSHNISSYPGIKLNYITLHYDCFDLKEWFHCFLFKFHRPFNNFRYCLIKIYYSTMISRLFKNNAFTRMNCILTELNITHSRKRLKKINNLLSVQYLLHSYHIRTQMSYDLLLQ